MSSPSAPWVGTFHVRPTVGRPRTIPEDIAGGYVHVVALASDEEGFRRLVTERLAEDHLDVLDIEEMSPVAERPDELDDAAQAALARLGGGSTVEAGTFFGYEKDDA